MLPSAPDLRLVCSSCVDPYTLEASIYDVRRLVCCFFPDIIKEPFHEKILFLICCYPLCVTRKSVFSIAITPQILLSNLGGVRILTTFDFF